jgi:hypothetical protein
MVTVPDVFPLVAQARNLMLDLGERAGRCHDTEVGESRSSSPS